LCFPTAFNHIKKLDSASFRGLASLKNLDLTSNFISKLEDLNYLKKSVFFFPFFFFSSSKVQLLQICAKAGNIEPSQQPNE
jgi:hypothetical protein